jgi:hypothetical protein
MSDQVRVKCPLAVIERGARVLMRTRVSFVHLAKSGKMKKKTVLRSSNTHNLHENITDMNA